MKIIERFRPETETWIEEGCHIVELHNTESDADCSIARARLAPGRTTRLHCLEGIVERYVILEGAGEVQINNEPPAIVSALDVVNIQAGAPQRITNTGQTDLIFLCVCTPRFVADKYQDMGE